MRIPIQPKNIEWWLNLVLCTFLLLFPFTFVISTFFPVTVFLPFFIPDLFLVIIGILLLLQWKKMQLTHTQILVVGVLLFFIFFAAITVIQQYDAIQAALSGKDTAEAYYDLFKRLISQEPSHVVNKLFHLILAFFLFHTVLTSNLKKTTLLTYAIYPLFFILALNLFFVFFQIDVSYNPGLSSLKLTPYPLQDVGRVYFPFVNTLLLSLYVSSFFFIIFYFYLHTTHKLKRSFLVAVLFLLIFILALTKSRSAQGFTLLLYLSLCIFLYCKTKLLKGKMFVSGMLALFLFFVFLGGILFHNITIIPELSTFFAQEKTIEMDITPQASPHTLLVEKNTSLFLEQKKDTVVGYYANPDARYRLHRHWPTAIALFKTAPFFGIGSGLFFYRVLNTHTSTLCLSDALCPNKMQPTDISSTTHSIYFQILAENGAMGIFVFFALIGGIFWHGYKQRDTMLSVFLFACIISILFQGTLFSYFEYPEMLYLFWFFVALFLKNNDLPNSSIDVNHFR